MMAQQKVNVEKAREIGVTILQSTVGLQNSSHSPKQIRQSHWAAVNCEDNKLCDSVNVHPQLLFHRLIGA